MIKNVFLLLISLSMSLCLYAQRVYQLNALADSKDVLEGHLQMGNPGLESPILLNNRYMTIGGNPVVPVMGEVHYSRVYRDRWEEILLKMKANGITIIACYVIWNHHEEIEGQFEWTGQKDLRSFIKLCQKHRLLVVPRIGPWVHGEVRNGGTPDWILNKRHLTDRSNHPAYQGAVDKLYGEISSQLEGLLYKDGGPVVGIQLENEYRRGEGGNAHILWLKKTALEKGLDVPMYTVTGWGAASVPQDEVIPLYGGYPARPWTTDIQPLRHNDNFIFKTAVNDPSIGDEGGQKDLPRVDLSRYPYFTCEIGVGNQLSAHRRPIIHPLDGVTIAMAKVGSGSNLPGYYVFTGGSNPHGILTSMEENQTETGYWNEYPDVSYDFQAAIRETGEIASSYHETKLLHYFLKDFGAELAPMRAVFNSIDEFEDELQLAVRTNDSSGFLFGLNYCRNRVRSGRKNVQFDIQFDGENIQFPTKVIDIPANVNFIWPLNLDLGGVTLQYATAQPVGKVRGPESVLWVFAQNHGIAPEFALKDAHRLITTSGKITEKGACQVVTNFVPSLDHSLRWTDANGQKNAIIVIPEDLTKQIWLLNGRLFLSDAVLYDNSGELNVLSSNTNALIHSLKNTKLQGIEPSAETGFFNTYEILFPKTSSTASVKRLDALSKASWLMTSVEHINAKNELNHQFFVKEINLNNPSAIKSAQFTVYAESPYKIRVNDRWVNQTTTPHQVHRLDLTGYLVKGNNTILLDFPLAKGEKAFAGEVLVDYFNTDRVTAPTDETWLTTQGYTIPRRGAAIKNLNAPILSDTHRVLTPSNEFQVDLSYEPAEHLHSLYLHMDYVGDKGKLRQGHLLLADDFNNGTTWSINVFDRCGSREEQELFIDLSPLSADDKIFFDKKPAPSSIGTVNINSATLIPEYRTNYKITDQ